MILGPHKNKSKMSPSQAASRDTLILDHVVQKMLEELAAQGGRPVYTLTPAEARNTLLRAHPQAGTRLARTTITSRCVARNRRLAKESRTGNTGLCFS